MKRRALAWRLAAILVLAAGGFAAVAATRSDKDRTELWNEVGKGLIALVFAGILGTLLRMLADGYQARRQLEERRGEFRQDKYRRVVLATSALRKAQTLVEANRSVKTWSEQMLALIDAANELRLVKHEIVLSSESVDDPPFPNFANIEWLLRRMYGYVDSLTADFAENKWKYGEKQRVAEDKRELLEPLWDELRALDSVKALLADFDVKDVLAEIPHTEALAREADEDRISIDPDGGPERARILYEAAETVALKWIAAGALGTRPRRGLPRLRTARTAKPEAAATDPA
jgi:hypothetical protein